MVSPPSRNAGDGFLPGENEHGCQGSACMWFSQGCSIFCDCNEDNRDLTFLNNLCHNGAARPTINDPALLTYANPIPLLGGNWSRYHPWRAPGSAVPLDPCGVSGGTIHHGNDVAGGFGKQTIAGVQGYPGSWLPAVAHKTSWRAGSSVEVAWGITANHGGGYQYRACPLREGQNVTEACFQQHVLPFEGSTQVLRWQDGSEVTITATRTTEGTLPTGSSWTKNPIPACTSIGGGEYGKGCDKPQFPPPRGCNNTCWGKKVCRYDEPAVDCSKYPMWTTSEIPSIVDHVRVNLAPGEWVIQWRWDSEQTPQVWNSCGDVTVVANATYTAEQ